MKRFDMGDGQFFAIILAIALMLMVATVVVTDLR